MWVLPSLVEEYDAMIANFYRRRVPNKRMDRIIHWDVQFMSRWRFQTKIEESEFHVRRWACVVNRKVSSESFMTATFHHDANKIPENTFITCDTCRSLWWNTFHRSEP